MLQLRVQNLPEPGRDPGWDRADFGLWSAAETGRDLLPLFFLW